MKRSIFSLLVALLAAFPIFAQDAVHGNIMPPTSAFFDKACTHVLTVSPADIVLWDVATGTPEKRIDLGNNIQKYNPFTTTFTMTAFAGPELSKVIIDLSENNYHYGFLFDLATGGLSSDDGYFNDKAYTIDEHGDYTVFRNLRSNNGPAGALLEVGLAGSKTTMGVLSDFKATGASLDGKIVYGHEVKSNRLAIYDLSAGKVNKTKLKLESNSKSPFYYHLIQGLFYSSHWTYIPGKPWTSFYNVATGEVLEASADLKGPYSFSDDGSFALYYREGSTWSFVVKNIASKSELTAPWTSGMTAYLYNSRFPIDGKNYLYQMEGDVQNAVGRIVVYNMTNGTEVKSFSVMAPPETIAINKSLRESVIGGGEQVQQQQQMQVQQQQQKQVQQTYIADNNNVQQSDSKANYAYDSFDGLLVNYQPLELPWQLDYNSIQGRDVSNYAYKEKISYGHLSGSSLNAIGKIFVAEGNIGLLSLYRRTQGSLDLSWFKVSIFDLHGNHLQTENIGVTQKDASGVSSKVDFTVTDSGDYVLIHVNQRSDRSVEKKVITIDKYNGTIKF
jgi:hypothetical protein